MSAQLDKWIEEQEGVKRLDRAAVETIQLQKLNALLQREADRQGFYAGLPARLESLDRLADLPFTTPVDIAERGGGLLLCSQAEAVRAVSDQTSGVTGPCKRILYTRADLERTVAFFAAGLSALILPGSTALVAMPAGGPDGLAALIGRAVEALGARPVMAGGTYGETWRVIQQAAPRAYVGFPVPLLSLLRLFGPGSLKEALVSGDVCGEVVLGDIAERLGAKPYVHYGSREIGLGGGLDCPLHTGMHLRENDLIAEIVDPSGAVLPQGEWGELVLTTLQAQAMPLIRYRTGDRTRLLPGVCSCGSPLVRLDRVTRQSAPMAGLDDALFALPGLVDYSAAQTGEALQIDALTLGDVDPAMLRARAAAVMPGLRLTVCVRTARDADGPLYANKRILRRNDHAGEI